ncbi:PAS domain-containing protein [Halorhabdus sp. CBA1104]|uniref:histidine kinase N-terminal 7TM domain-containing protein n=1 Tax=Halorhabdus sp. CBA1104 TaxID=1380432 RepID=UPI0012B3F0BA|nr:histidine kinase N-terminal 7TM domain-containing protein [Halorhabdus sp. CBA1104]QGN06784.1 PAS domain-containing protein [Halorhabdus sp. CBA1104]
MWRLYLAVVFFAAVFGTALSLYTLLHQETPGAGPLALLLLGAAMWATTDGLSLATFGASETLFWAKLGLAITAVVPLAWLLTAVEYTGYDRVLTSRHLLGLLVEPLVFTGLVWTTGSHGLVWSNLQPTAIGPYTTVVATRGLAYWGHVVYSYGLIALGALLLVRVILRANELYRTQSTALLVAIVIPLVANTAALFGLSPDGIDMTSIAFVASGTVITAAILRRQLLSVAAGTREIGRDEIVDQLDDAVFILDSNGVVNDCNPAGATLVDETTDRVVGQSLVDLLPALSSVFPIEDIPDNQIVTIERSGSVRTYDCRLSPLDSPFGERSGTIVSVRDVTEQTRREQQLDVLNRLLRHNIRNEMNVVRGQAELLRESIETESQHSRVDRIVETVDTVTERSNKVGTLTRAFEDEPASIDLEAVLRDAIGAVTAKYPAATIALDGDPDHCVEGAASLGVAFEELLHNAVEHNDSDHPQVTVTVTAAPPSGADVTVRISDNGPGINRQERAVIERGRETALEHGSGIGLWLVAWIVRTYGGTLSFAEADVGTTVVVQLPKSEP